jgi:hypothetical protein
MRFFRKLNGILSGLCDAARLNLLMLLDRVRGRSNLVFHVNALSQFMHIEPLFRELKQRQPQSISVYLLAPAAEIKGLELRVASSPFPVILGLDKASRLLLFCDFFLTVDQGAPFPLVGCRTRACCFHGQPSKANTYQGYNYRQINTLFFYGPLMRNNYFRAKAQAPHWPDVKTHDVGQPLSDRLFHGHENKAEARRRLGLAADRFTVIYAPSFEYCSSMATDGRTIIAALLDLDINVIVKPHPGFYIAGTFNDAFNRGAPNAAGWRAYIEQFNARGNCVFTPDNSLDSVTALSAANVMLTDYSGIAFDGILFGMGMIYWDCPKFYREYLPQRYGIDGALALNDMACNVGRDAGIVVRDTADLQEAVRRYQEDANFLEAERRQIAGQLLFNPGRAAAAMTDRIEEILRGASR